MGHLPEYTTKRGYLPGDPALTAGCGFDQCPAPFARSIVRPVHPSTLQIAQATPDKPLLTPMLGSVS